jgi:hypothetical protein
VSIEVPEIKIVAPRGKFQIRSVNLSLIPRSLLEFNLGVKGKATLVIGEQKTEIEILNLNYSLRNKTGKAQFRIPKCPWETILWLAEALDFKLPSDLKITGNSWWELTFYWGKAKPVKFELSGRSVNPEIKYQNAKFNPQNLNFKLTAEGKTYFIKGNGSELRISFKNKEVALLKEIKIEGNQKGINLNIPIGYLINKQFSGKIGLSLGKMPVLNYNLKIAGLKIKGRGYLGENKLHTEGNVNQIRYSGIYNLEDRKFHLTAKGTVQIEKVYPLLGVKNELLNLLSGKIDLKNFSLLIDAETKSVRAYMTSAIRNLKYKDNLIAENGYLNSEIENNHLMIKNFELYPQNGKISISGEINLKNPFNFSGHTVINSVPVRRFISLFTPKDLGNAYLFGYGEFNGAIKELRKTEARLAWRFENGNLGKIKFLSQIGSLLNRPDLERIGFQKGEGKFILREENLFIPQTVLVSPLVNLYLQGRISLSGQLDLIAITEFTQQETRKETSPFDILQNLLIQGLSQLAYKIKITGSIKEPKYVIIPAGVDKLFENLLPPDYSK